MKDCWEGCHTASTAIELLLVKYHFVIGTYWHAEAGLCSGISGKVQLYKRPVEVPRPILSSTSLWKCTHRCEYLWNWSPDFNHNGSIQGRRPKRTVVLCNVHCRNPSKTPCSAKHTTTKVSKHSKPQPTRWVLQRALFADLQKHWGFCGTRSPPFSRMHLFHLQMLNLQWRFDVNLRTHIVFFSTWANLGSRLGRCSDRQRQGSPNTVGTAWVSAVSDMFHAGVYVARGSRRTTPMAKANRTSAGAQEPAQQSKGLAKGHERAEHRHDQLRQMVKPRSPREALDFNLDWKTGTWRYLKDLEGIRTILYPFSKTPGSV